MATKKIEIQDSNGNVYYPHTDASIVKNGSKTVAEQLNDIAQDITNLKKDNWIRGKIINFMGDSITWGQNPTTGNTTAPLDNPFPKVVGSILNCTCNNYGIPGSSLGDNGGMCDRVLDMDTNAIINVIWGGTNDWGGSRNLGTILDSGKDSVYGALNILCENLKTKFPNAMNVFITPMKRGDSLTNENYSLETVGIAIKEVAQKYNFLVIDAYNNMPNFNPKDNVLKSRWCQDGLHPNQDYINKFLARYVVENLLSINHKNEIDNAEYKAYFNDVTHFSNINSKLTRSGNTCDLSFNCMANIDAGEYTICELHGSIANKYIPRIGNCIYLENGIWNIIPIYLTGNTVKLQVKNALNTIIYGTLVFNVD